MKFKLLLGLGCLVAATAGMAADKAGAEDVSLLAAASAVTQPVLLAGAADARATADTGAAASRHARIGNHPAELLYGKPVARTNVVPLPPVGLELR